MSHGPAGKSPSPASAHIVDRCPDCQLPAERDDEEVVLRLALEHPFQWDARLDQDRRTLEFCRQRLREHRVVKSCGTQDVKLLTCHPTLNLRRKVRREPRNP